MALVAAGRTPIHIETAGSGPSLVLLHANGGDRRDFAALIPALVESGWRVTSVDWPGHGDSPRSEPETAVGFGAVLVDLLDTLGGSHVLLGNSVGGFAALYAAAHRPEPVAGLVLVSPGGFTPNWFGMRLACRLIGSKPLAPLTFRWLPHLYLRERNPDVAAAFERAEAGSRSPKQTAVYGSVWRSFTETGHDARSLATQVRCPVLLAWGTRDPVLPWRIDGRRACESMPEACLEVFPGLGHQPFIEEPGEFLRRTAPFLSEIKATSR